MSRRTQSHANAHARQNETNRNNGWPGYNKSELFLLAAGSSVDGGLEAHDAREFFRNERGSPHERPVDVGARHELVYRFGGDGSACSGRRFTPTAQSGGWGIVHSENGRMINLEPSMNVDASDLSKSTVILVQVCSLLIMGI